MASKTPEGSIDITQITTKKGNYENPTEYETLTDFSDYKIIWDDPYKQTTAKASNLPIGEYYVSFVGKNKCVSPIHAGSIDAFVNLTPRIASVEDTIYDRKTICFEDSLQLNAEVKEIYTHGYSPASAVREYTWSSRANNTLTDLSSNTTQKVWANPLTNYYADSSEVFMQYKLDGCTSAESQYSINHFDSIAFALEVFDTYDNYLGKDSVFAIKNNGFIINPTQEPWFISQIEGKDGIMFINWSSLDASKQRQGQLHDTVTNEATYVTSNNYGLSTFAKEPNYYYAVANTTHGCKERAEVFINVFSDVFVPTGITPNGDGNNDTWVVPYLYLCPNARVTVYNRWGVKLYENESNYYQNPWDGTNKNGKILPMGTYYYIIEYNDNNNTEPQAGAITILH
jgi:gliding motility-associated-like protein